MTDTNILLAGFGGQGVLFAGKVLAYAGLEEKFQITWMPSYGPEMRGGTANCSVCVSDGPIGSPLVLSPDILVAMNAPSYHKFIGSVAPGGVAIVDSSLIHDKCQRDDIQVYYVPATRLAKENNLEGLANLIMLGKITAVKPFVSAESVKTAIEKCVPKAKAHLVDANKRAAALGSLS